jgi:hypothetical protein
MLGSGLSLWQNDGGIDVVQQLQPQELAPATTHVILTELETAGLV